MRRIAQLTRLFPGASFLPIRGNLDTRLRKLDSGDFDAIVLAAAGLVRLGLAERIRMRFSAAQMLPAAGQGALGIEVRADDDELRAALGALTHRPTWLAVHAERAVSRGLGGSCSMPLAAHAQWQGDGRLQLAAALGHGGDPRRPLLTTRAVGAIADEAAAEALGAQAVAALHACGARDYLSA